MAPASGKPVSRGHLLNHPPTPQKGVVLLSKDSSLTRLWGGTHVTIIPDSIISAKLSPSALRVWLALASFSNKEHHCYPSHRKLAERLPDGMTENTIRSACRELEDKNLLIVSPLVRGDGGNSSNDYVLCHPEHETKGDSPPIHREAPHPVQGEDSPSPQGDMNLSITNSTKKEVEDTSDLLGSEAIREVFDAWIVSTGRTAATRLDGKRKRLIESALKEYPMADVLDAVNGWEHSAWHRGENPSGKQYNDLGLLLRDASKIEEFRDRAREDPVVSEPESWSVLRRIASEETG
jgi:hypothetical protein